MPDAEIIHRGEWWLPEAPDDVQSGVLRIDENRQMTLELVKGFDTDLVGPADEQGTQPITWIGHWDMIHGRTSREYVTLLGVNLKSSSWLFGTVANQTLGVDIALVGTALDEPEEAAFTGVQAEIDNLLYWSVLTAFQSSIEFQENKFKRSYAEGASVDALHAEWNGFKISLGLRFTAFQAEDINPNQRTVGGTETAWIKFEHEELQTASTYFELVATFQDLLTLAMDYPCAIRGVTYSLEKQSDDPTPMTPTAKGYYRYIFPADSKPFKRRDRKHFFRLDDTDGFDAIVPRWFDLVDRIRTGLRRVLSINYAGETMVGAELMTQTSALESLHRSLYDHPKMPPEEFKELVGQVLEGVDKRWVNLVRGSIRNDLSYAMRVKELVRQPDPEAVQRLLVDESKWITQIQRGRNALAHATNHRDSLSFDLQFRLLMVTRAFSALVIGQELGIPAETQRRFVMESDVNYHSRQFGQLIGVLPDTPQVIGTRTVVRELPPTTVDEPTDLPEIPDVTEPVEPEAS
jgi:hypothetical protein